MSQNVHMVRHTKLAGVDVAANTVVVYSDIMCAWAHLAVYRLHAARAKLDLQDRIHFDMRAFPLELFNNQATPKDVLEAEIAVLGGLDPEAGWQMWQRPDSEYPVTSLPALEAVQAAKAQGLRASEELDRALRVAFFGASRVISLHHEILDIATGIDDLDAGKLADALETGSSRAAVIEQKQYAEGDEVRGSPHIFLPDGTDEHNPGIRMEWHKDHGVGFPVVLEDKPEIYLELMERAAS